MIRDKLVTAAYLHQMHPDIFEATPQVKMIVKGWNEIDELRRVQEFWLEVCEAGLPYPDPDNQWTTTWFRSQTVTQYDEKYNIDEEATVKMFARIVKWARSKGYEVTKNYSESYFTVRVHVPGLKMPIEFNGDRETMCQRVHVGTEVIPAVPEKVIDKYDWRCEKIAFLGVDTDG